MKFIIPTILLAFGFFTDVRASEEFFAESNPFTLSGLPSSLQKSNLKMQ
jgi:hypothetical protein